MKHAQKLSLLAVSAIALANMGCIITANAWGLSIGPSVWTETETQRINLDTTHLTALEVRTHNGGIQFEGQDRQSSDAYIIATKKAGGLTLSDAEDAMDALEVYVEKMDNGLQKIGWRWDGLKHITWRASVSFEIKAPGNIDFDGRSHNGGIELVGVRGNVTLETHNGSISSESSGQELYAETHNGRINATFSGQEMTMITHNGRVVADLSGCGEINGNIETHNGGVELTLGENASVNLKCRTHNGSIRCKVPIQDSDISRSRLVGRIGSGAGKLNVTTHNGSVRIE